MDKQGTYTTNPHIFLSVPFQTFFHNKVQKEETTYNTVVEIPSLKKSLYRDFTEMERDERSFVTDDMEKSLVMSNYVLDEFFVSLVQGNLLSWVALFADNVKRGYLFDQVKENATKLFGTSFLEQLLWHREVADEYMGIEASGVYTNAVIVEFLKNFNNTGNFTIEPFNDLTIWRAYQHNHLTGTDLYNEAERLVEDIDKEMDIAKYNGLIKHHNNKKINNYVYKIFCNANRIQP